MVIVKVPGLDHMTVRLVQLVSHKPRGSEAQLLGLDNDGNVWRYDWPLGWEQLGYDKPRED